MSKSYAPTPKVLFVEVDYLPPFFDGIDLTSCILVPTRNNRPYLVPSLMKGHDHELYDLLDHYLYRVRIFGEWYLGANGFGDRCLDAVKGKLYEHRLDLTAGPCYPLKGREELLQIMRTHDAINQSRIEYNFN
ncbi:MAG: hypothetical protein ISS48_04650 [Candidatus Aenigmarchaeota archaeon]|nr:hypothetical protein [Candidatus Aenigmarchaeota archaeon]